MRSRLQILIGLLMLTGCASTTVAPAPVFTAQEWAASCEPWDDWDKPAKPFRIHGPTWYVGTCGIAVLLVETSDGLVLFDSGTEAGADVVLANIRSLGFDPADVALILSSHEHHDHVGGMEKLRVTTGARVLASPAAASVMRTGRADPQDPQYGMHDRMTPVSKVESFDLTKPVAYGGTLFQAIATPGHTPGALSWTWESCHNEKCVDIVYADSLSPVSRDDYRFSDHPDYVDRYRSGLDRLRTLPCDILLTPHPSASRMLVKARDGDWFAPPDCKAYADGVERRLDERLASEAE